MLRVVAEVSVNSVVVGALAAQIERQIESAPSVPVSVLRDYRAFLARPVDFFELDASVSAGSVDVTARPGKRLERLLSFCGGVE